MIYRPGDLPVNEREFQLRANSTSHGHTDAVRHVNKRNAEIWLVFKQIEKGLVTVTKAIDFLPCIRSFCSALR